MGASEDGAALRRAGDVDAAAALKLEQPFVAEEAERAEDGVGVDTEDCCEVAGGREPLAGLRFAVGDGAADLGSDLLEEFDRFGTVDLDAKHRASNNSIMSAAVPALPLEVDPLIADAKRRARRRRLLLVLVAAAAVAAAATATLETRSGAAATGVCVTVPSGWKERIVRGVGLEPPTAVLTNFRFGQMDDIYGLGTPLRWPRTGVMVAVSNSGPATPASLRSELHVDRSDFGSFEGMSRPGTSFAVHANGRVLSAFVEVGTVTPATIAAANRALAGVRACSS